MAPSLSSPHLLSCVIVALFTTLASAELRFIGKTYVFRCHSNTTTASPIFQHKPNGATSPVNLFTGVDRRPDVDLRITAEIEVDATSGSEFDILFI